LRQPYRICLMLDQLAAAGTELHCVGLARGLDRLKFFPYMVLLKPDPSSLDDPDGFPCDVTKLGIGSLLGLSSLRSLMRLAAELRRRKIDLVQTFSPDSTYFGLLAAKMAGVPVVVRALRNTGYWMRPRDRRLQSICSKFIDWNIANSEAAARSAERIGVGPSKVSVILSGIDTSLFADVDPVLGSSIGGEAHVGIVANLRPVKNLEVFIAASARLTETHRKVRFIIAGEGPDRAHLEKRIRNLGLAETVELRGRVDDIPSFLETLDVAVLCSSSESLPTVVIEYMAAGRPIVATNVGGVSELIRDEATGLLVPSDNPEALAAAIDRLLADREMASRLGRAARQEAERSYTHERQQRQHCELWARLVDTRKTPC